MGSYAVHILVRMTDIPGRCHVAGYGKPWFLVNEVKFGAKNETKFKERRARDIAGAKFKQLTISKRIDNSTTSTMFMTLQGSLCKALEVHYIGSAGGGAPTPFQMIRFDDLYLVEWKFNADGPSEELNFEYRKVAMEYHYSEDGVNFKRTTSHGWDNTPPDPQPWDFEFKRQSREVREEETADRRRQKAEDRRKQAEEAEENRRLMEELPGGDLW